MINVTVWNEYGEPQKAEDVQKIYSGGVHSFISGFLKTEKDFSVTTAILDEKEHGLTEEKLKKTDVLLWWGHCFHDRVDDKIVERVVEYVHKGMGIVFLHSAHHSKPFKRILGTSGNLSWRDNDEKERIWTVDPSHKIAEGIPENFILEHEEMYGEPFDIPNPESVVFMGWFKGGNVFRSGVTYKRGRGKVFYFQPGHEKNPSYHNENVQKIIKNAIRWAADSAKTDKLECPHCEKSLEPIE